MNGAARRCITHLASGDLWAGAEAQLFDLVTALREDGRFDVDVVLFNEGLLFERLVEAAIPVTVLNERRHGAPALLWQLRTHLRVRGTKILHSHRLKEHLIGSAAVLTLRGLRAMRTVHGESEQSIRATDVRRRALHAADWLCARFIQRPIVCVSSHLKSQMKKDLPAERLVVITNGVDLTRVRAEASTPATLPPTPRKFRIGYFGRFVPVKRLDLIISTARRLEDEFPGLYSFHLFGDGPLRLEVERIIRQEGLDDAVRLMGFVRLPAAFLRQMDALLLTSDHEGLPMIILEAMALGVPVVSRAVGEIPDVLDEGRAGSLVCGDDPAAFAAAIAQRCTAGASDVRIARARERVAVEYSATRTAREYAAVYSSLAP